MITTMRHDINPLCDDHHEPMRLKGLESGNLTAKAFVCLLPNCSRAYNGSLGYFDVTQDGWLAEKWQQKCPKDGHPMFLESISSEGENWRCAQVNCDHAQLMVDSPRPKGQTA